jgi:hypothetical protein
MIDATIGVSMKPGATQFTLILFGARVTARDLVSATTPAFEAE